MKVQARTCKGCGKPNGCDSYQFDAYWHLRCLLKERERRAAVKKLTRKELLRTVNSLQGLIGQAMGAYQNDRAPDRAEQVMTPLTEAHELCVSALSPDPPLDVNDYD
jgi:hypothetical protein